MSKRIFDKHKGTAESEKDLRSPVDAFSADVESAAKSATPVVDDAFLALTRELSGLGEMEVSRAAKERGWASLQRELERHPIRAAGSPVKAGARPVRSWRWAIASAAAAVAVLAGVLGAYGGGAFNSSVADNGHPTTVTSAVAGNTTEPGSTSSTSTPSTSGTQPDTTGTVVAPTTTGPAPSTSITQPTSPSTSGPSTTQTQTSTTKATTGTTQATTSTTQPSSSTTVVTDMASKERASSASMAVSNLGLAVISGDYAGARALVDPQAQGPFAQMVASLSDPNAIAESDPQLLSTDTYRVTLSFTDHVANGQGIVVERTLRFVLKVHVTAKGALVTAINAG